MKILAVETSCDETSASIVEDGRTVLSNVISSQADFHSRYGGVIPEMAARQHLETINFVVEEALQRSGLKLCDIDAFSSTLGPGLIGALLVGATAAKTLSFITSKPFLGVNHLYAHIASNYLESDLSPPFICLLISGGHTQLLHVASFKEIYLIGETLDDAVGEAYDKVARIIGLGYPGGPLLDALAQQGKPDAFTLPQAKTDNFYDFSYSGLKTAVLRIFEKYADTEANGFKQDLAASFQEAATAVLLKKTFAAAESFNIKTIAIAGGVAANSSVRKKFFDECEKRADWKLFIPALVYCTDNAAMVGSSAYFNPITKDPRMEVFSRGEIP